MARWLDLAKSIKSAFDADAGLDGISIQVGRDQPIPAYPAIRIRRGDGSGEQRLRARAVSAEKYQDILIEAWEGSNDPDPVVAYDKLAELEDKIDAALATWADAPPDIEFNFYPHITKRTPADETLTRPAVGTLITLTIKHI